ncbi:[FeFe] hydrogenase H-cluster radical SAM maturase HydE [candidate division KSB3 bacterium]|uniref:[FeFe] hydrogenase H-cluster radical SAM maturase HydE n=1 Tax=candidate division KSB3 bacterium TaxID=2044937 RepID=A0A2G6E745_9BACT|nr:MAG: [FeFe] hydrogenase H-cluster radical SAM maturase HydE [candidate division KSB3 bacterium]
MLKAVLDKIDAQDLLEREDMVYLLGLRDPDDIRTLHERAYRVKEEQVGKTTYFRGLIELSNICVKDCYYCGIRKSNCDTTRYQMAEQEIIEAACWAHQQNYGSIVLQAGERSDPQFVDFIESVLKRIREQCCGELGITLSLGEQPEEHYRRWFEAGAHRYLLRIETSNKALYTTLHPPDHHFDTRKACLNRLRKTGYQVGTGVMIGLPGQTYHDLVDDILFFQDQDIDMIGMGPFLLHANTPLGVQHAHTQPSADEQLRLGLNMIAVTRLVMKDVNIAATTALQALRHDGREMGLQAGANIIMPNVTDTKYRASYQLYQNKPSIDENASLCRSRLEHRIYDIGEEIGYRKWGDSPRFFSRSIKAEAASR